MKNDKEALTLQQCTSIYSGKQCQLDSGHPNSHFRQLDSGQRLTWWDNAALTSNGITIRDGLAWRYEGDALVTLTPGECAQAIERLQAGRENVQRINDNGAREIERLRASLENADGCFEAALVEGWLDALANGDIDRIRDIWERRIQMARAALSDDSPAPETSVPRQSGSWVTPRQFAAEAAKRFARGTQIEQAIIQTFEHFSGEPSAQETSALYKCDKCGTPMRCGPKEWDHQCRCYAEKASEQECRRSDLSEDAAGTGPADTRAEARLSRREITAQKASEDEIGNHCKRHPAARYVLKYGCPSCSARLPAYSLQNGKGD